MYSQWWENAANHASQEIRDRGTWSCPCEDCYQMRAKILYGMEKGKCLRCGGPVTSRRSDYCSPACKQTAYRQRIKANKASAKE